MGDKHIEPGAALIEAADMIEEGVRLAYEAADMIEIGWSMAKDEYERFPSEVLKIVDSVTIDKGICVGLHREDDRYRADPMPKEKPPIDPGLAEEIRRLKGAAFEPE